MLFQLLVISLQRLDRFEEAEAQGNRAMSALTFSPWHKELMAITLGSADPQAVYAAACSDDERCQLRCYEGLRYATYGKHLEAKKAFAECLSFSTELMEKTMVDFEFKAIENNVD